MRHVIRDPRGLYYTEMRIAETRQLRDNGGNTTFVENVFRPVFEGFAPKVASQLNTRRDAEELMANPYFGAPASFADCTIESYSTDAVE